MISEMEWSYSRLTSFEDCKYRWLLQYILKKKRGDPQFFSTYGTFMHDILERYLSGRLKKEELVPHFLEHYDEQVVGEAPSPKIADNFFNHALTYLQTIDFPYQDIVSTEKKVKFKVDDYNFVGYIDVLARRGKGYHIVDHKSHGLLPRTNRRFQTVSDKELDKYLRQQYLYAIPIKEEYGSFPKTLNFNCYRHGRFITERFNIDRLEQTKQWVRDQISEIMHEQDWDANPEPFKCNFICDMKDHCRFCPRYQCGGKR